MKKCVEFGLCAGTGAVLYGLLELWVRGFTHWSMVLTAGCAMLVLRLINETPQAPLQLRCLLGAAVMTGFEFAAGMILNRALGLGIWDYAAQPWNYKGQICLQYSAGWFVLCIPAFLLCGRIHRSLCSSASAAARQSARSRSRKENTAKPQ